SVWMSIFFFFSSRRRHTRCLSDWSSDVCSSDLSALGARWHQPGRRRFRIQAAVAWPVGHPENGDLTLKAENGSVDIGLAQQNARSEERRVGKECRSRWLTEY